MDKVLLEFLQYGATGITAIIGYYLFFKERSINRESSRIYLQQQVSDAKGKVKLTIAIENQTKIIKWMAHNLNAYLTEKRFESKFRGDDPHSVCNHKRLEKPSPDFNDENGISDEYDIVDILNDDDEG